MDREDDDREEQEVDNAQESAERMEKTETRKKRSPNLSESCEFYLSWKLQTSAAGD